jgi:hypothetical protein
MKYANLYWFLAGDIVWWLAEKAKGLLREESVTNHGNNQYFVIFLCIFIFLITNVTIYLIFLG